MVQFFATLALIASDAVADDDWALTLLSAAIETRANPARTIKIRRIPNPQLPRLPRASSETPSKPNRIRRTETSQEYTHRTFIHGAPHRARKVRLRKVRGVWNVS